MFNPNDIDFDILKKRAFNHRWAECESNVIPLTAADFDFKCSTAVQKAIINYTKDGYFNYGPKNGLTEFIQAIQEYYLTEKEVNFPIDNILPIDSVARAMYIFADTTMDKGENIIIFDPVDYLFARATEAAGANALRCPINSDGTFDRNYFINLIDKKTKAIGLCNPHNPYGRVIKEDDLKWLVEISRKYDLVILNDEIWSDIIYSDVNFCSIEKFTKNSDKVITVYGLSKSFALAGLRIGAAATKNNELFNKYRKFSHVESTAGGVTTISQIAGIAALKTRNNWLKDMMQYIEKNRDYCVQRINNIKKLKCMMPEATYLLFIDIKETKDTTESFVQKLEQKAKVKLMPGSPEFFGPGANGYVRLSYATSIDILYEALDRIEKFMNNNY